MKRTGSTLAVILCASAMVLAQESYPGNRAPSNPGGVPADSQAQQQSDMPGTYHEKVRGCLSGSDGNYTLTSDSGRTYRLQGNEDHLVGSVGKEVEISFQPTGTRTSDPSPVDSSRQGAAASQWIQVTGVSAVADSCLSGSPSSREPGIGPSKSDTPQQQ
jgi:hypothetical protein